MSSYKLSYLERILRAKIQHYDSKKYWKMREAVVNYKEGFFEKIKCLYYLYKIKKCDAFNNASLGTFLGKGAEYKTIPNFPHGLYGIIISGEAKIGKNCTIFHQVTIGTNGHGVPIIGDNVLIGAGAKILGPIKVGNGSKIGANVVVTKNIPENSVVVLQDVKVISIDK